MKIIIHRVNKIETLQSVPKQYGVEIDVRGYGNRLLLSHDPIDDPESCDELEGFLSQFHHDIIVFNMKEAGYEKQVTDLADKYSIDDYFLLDVEFPYIYRATRRDGFRKIAIRYSEAEPIEAVKAQMGENGPLVDWVWIDTNTKLPLDQAVIRDLAPFKTCLVCPERWGRPGDIQTYIDKMKELKFKPDAVMTSLACKDAWERAYEEGPLS